MQSACNQSARVVPNLEIHSVHVSARTPSSAQPPATAPKRYSTRPSQHRAFGVSTFGSGLGAAHAGAATVVVVVGTGAADDDTRAATSAGLSPYAGSEDGVAPDGAGAGAGVVVALALFAVVRAAAAAAAGALVAAAAAVAGAGGKEAGMEAGTPSTKATVSRMTSAESSART